MKVYDKPIDMLCWFMPDGSITVIRFRFTNKNGEVRVIPVHTTKKPERSKKHGKSILDILCTAVVNGQDYIINLHYYIQECRWVLHKM